MSIGLTTTGQSVAPGFLASADWVVYRTVVIDATAEDAGNTSDTKHLRPGLVLGKVTASGKYKAYNNAATDGTEVARAILAEEVQMDGTNDKVARVVICGVAKRSDLIGLDAGAETDLATASNGALIVLV